MGLSRWWLVRLEYERDVGPRRFWWLSKGEDRKSAGFEAHRRFAMRDTHPSRLVGMSVFDLDWLDKVVDEARDRVE